MKVLILGVATVQYDAIKTLQKLGHEVHACARTKDGIGADAADYFVELDFSDQKAVEDYIRKQGIDVVYSVGSDLAMPISTAISERLKLPHFVSSETARICNNKDRLREILGSEFPGNIPHQILSSQEETPQLPFPFILKPTDSQGQRGVYIIESETEYRERFEEVRQYSRSGLVIVEQYISGPELSVNGYLVDGEIRYLVASDRETWPQFPGLIHRHVVPGHLDGTGVDADIHNLMKRTCERLQIQNGPVYAQIKVEKEKPYLIEITPRLDGCHMWKLLTYSTGINLLEWTLNHLLTGQGPEPPVTHSPVKRPFMLEFICQEPHTPADYSEYENQLEQALESMLYYESGQTIKPVNGKYEKIGYLIFPGDKGA